MGSFAVTAHIYNGKTPVRRARHYKKKFFVLSKLRGGFSASETIEEGSLRDPGRMQP